MNSIYDHIAFCSSEQESFVDKIIEHEKTLGNVDWIQIMEKNEEERKEFDKWAGNISSTNKFSGFCFVVMFLLAIGYISASTTW